MSLEKHDVRVIICSKLLKEVIMPFKCKNMEGCYMYNLLTTSVRIIRLQPFLTGYCEDSVKYLECARYKLIETGKEPPSDLLPDGKKLTA